MIFGSATPSVKSYLMAKEGRYKEYRLTRRAGDALLPDIHVVGVKGKKPFSIQPYSSAEDLRSSEEKGTDHAFYQPERVCGLCFL